MVSKQGNPGSFSVPDLAKEYAFCDTTEVQKAASLGL
jgi:hypothetical protein